MLSASLEAVPFELREVVWFFPFKAVLLDALDAVLSEFWDLFMPREDVLFVPFNGVSFDDLNSLRFVALDTT
jgi:hypothetical protein